MTPEDPDDTPPIDDAAAPDAAPEPDAPTTPLRNRMGRLAAIFGAVVLAGLVLINFSGGPDDGDSDLPDPADIPRGALAGTDAPRFALEMFDGTTFDLEQHLAEDGRPIVLNFWASWCVPCRQEMPEFDEVADTNPDVLFVGVAVRDQVAPARQFAEEIDVSYPLGIDETNAIADLYPHIGLPTTFFVNADGTIARQIQGQVTGEFLEALIEYDFG